MPMPDSKRARLKWLALFVFGFSLFVMLAMSAGSFRSTSLADRLAKVVGHQVSENVRLAASLGIGLAAEFVVLASAYLLFPKRRDGI